MLCQEHQLSSSPVSDPIIHTPDTDWAFDTFEVSEPSIWDDVRSRQNRTPDNFDYEVRLPSIKPKRVGIFSRKELKDKAPEIKPLFREAHEKILALAQDNTSATTASQPSSSSQTQESDHGPSRELPVQWDLFTQTPHGQPAESWTEFNSSAPIAPAQHHDPRATSHQVPLTMPTSIPYPRFKFRRGPANHRCTRTRHAGNFGCADMRVRVIHDASHHSGLHYFPGRFQGVIDLQVCDLAMANTMPGWDALLDRQLYPNEPINIRVNSDLDTVKYAAKWLLDQIHYPTTEASIEYLDMQTLSSAVELADRFGGAGPRIDDCIRWALLNAEVSSLEDTLFGLHVSTLASNADLLHMFRDFLALNFTGEDIAASVHMLGTVAPYLPYVLSDAICSLYDIRRNIIHEILQSVERALDDTWKRPIDVTRFHFLCALKYRFMSPASLENDTFDLCGLMLYMHEIILVKNLPYNELFDEFKCAFVDQGVLSNFTPFAPPQQYY
ncbi:hypothetical protein Sste5346_008490 [Sporothrix stenoceras]|uniref:Uncharacterized protein n=1 Tax=Sporothrix stenoceras TaxID=5173 RepID=A0ABR3YQ41_9PEZI